MRGWAAIAGEAAKAAGWSGLGRQVRDAGVELAKQQSDFVGQDGGSGAGGEVGSPAGVAPKRVPNPHGKLSSPAHQGKVAEIVADIVARHFAPYTAYSVDTPAGTKRSRYVDVLGMDAQGNIVEMRQIGRQTKAGLPVFREVKALDDIERATGLRPTFHPYNN